MKDEKYFKEVKNIIERIEISHQVRQIEENIERVQGYWEIGKQIVEAQGGEKRAKYGTNLIKEWGVKLSKEYGLNYGYRNLELFRKFYLLFEKAYAVRTELTCTHYKRILFIPNENERNYYINQVIINHLSTRELDQAIKNKDFDRLSYADKEHIEVINDSEVIDITDMIKSASSL